MNKYIELTERTKGNEVKVILMKKYITYVEEFIETNLTSSTYEGCNAFIHIVGKDYGIPVKETYSEIKKLLGKIPNNKHLTKFDVMEI